MTPPGKAHRAAAQERADEIEAAKQVLMSAHRLRAIGVTLNCSGDWSGFDSWEKSNAAVPG